MKTKMLKDRILTLRLPEAIYDKVDYLAEQQWCSVSAVIRNGIRKELDENEDLFTDEYIKSQQHHFRAY
jgi:predicted DNA-binding protein